MVWEEMTSEEFQDGVHGGHLRYRNGTTLALLNLYVAPMPPIKFWLKTVWEEMSFEVFQDGHLGYGNITILAILCFYNSPKPPINL